jgi:putative transposase
MKKRYSPEQIVGMLRQADVGLGRGLKVPEVCKQLGISEQTYCRWRQKYGGMSSDLARQLKALE